VVAVVTVLEVRLEIEQAARMLAVVNRVRSEENIGMAAVHLDKT